MKSQHHTLMGIGLVAVLAICVVTTQPWAAVAGTQDSRVGEAQHSHATEAQHSHAGEAQDHFHALVEQLDLNEDQQHALSEPFHEAFAAMQKLHELHGVIAAKLTEEQRGKLAEMIHEMLGGAAAEQMHEHGAPHEAHR
jgi:flagellar motility protein MotE (MotC chaperone)